MSVVRARGARLLTHACSTGNLRFNREVCNARKWGDDSSLGNIRWEVKIVVAIARDGKNGEKSENNVKEHRKMVRSVVSSDGAFMCCCPSGCVAQNALATFMFDLICLPIQSSTMGGEHWALD